MIGYHAVVIKLLSKELFRSRYPFIYAGFRRFGYYSHSMVPEGFGVRS